MSQEEMNSVPKKSSNKRDAKPESKRGLAGDTLSINSIEQLKAIADPLRQQLLEQFAIKPATTMQVAVTLGYQPTRLYHHVAKLENAGLIRLVETRPVRGTTEKYYSAVATRIRIDRRAFEDRSAEIANKIASLGVIDSLLANVRREVADFLGQSDHRSGKKSAKERVEQEVLFVQAEVEADEKTVLKLREKIYRLIDEVEAITQNGADEPEDIRKYRLVIGWYPRVPTP